MVIRLIISGFLLRRFDEAARGHLAGPWAPFWEGKQVRRGKKIGTETFGKVTKKEVISRLISGLLDGLSVTSDPHVRLKKEVIMKRGRLFSIFLGVFLATLSVSLIRAQEPVYEALNPRGTMPDVKTSPLSPRPADLRNKVVYNINIGKPAGDLLCPELETALKEAIPEVKIVYRKKQLSFLTDEPNLWKEVAEKADAAILSIAD